jgi:hypothetical protein
MVEAKLDNETDYALAQDHEVPKREPRAPLCLFGKTEPGLAAS